jgi:hypothetical protein
MREEIEDRREEIFSNLYLAAVGVPANGRKSLPITCPVLPLVGGDAIAVRVRAAVLHKVFSLTTFSGSWAPLPHFPVFCRRST